MEQELRGYAYRLLGRRDYSRHELREKLLSNYALRIKRGGALPRGKNEADHLVEALLDELKENGFQSDDKFTRAFIRQGVNRGWGPMKIRHKLRTRGVEESIITANLPNEDDFWLGKALDIAKRRYAMPLASVEEKGKCYRFLLSRGFSGAHAKRAVQGPQPNE